MQPYSINGHVTLDKLKKQKHNNYLSKISSDKYKIPAYPRPELHITHVSHSTEKKGLEGINADRGFRDPNENGEGCKDPNENGEMKVVWFSLTITPKDLRNAETRPMTIVRSGGVEEQSGPIRGEAEGETSGPGVLLRFATSPAFLSSSRYGSYRFTFDLKDVLKQYSKQFCGGNPPVMRQWKTVLYSQEVMYVVLVHSPDEDRFRQRSLLEDTENSICAFRMKPKPFFVWRPQAMCETHRLELVGSGETVSVKTHLSVKTQFFVWDHVALALVVDEKVLRFNDNKLRKSLRFCEEGYPPINNTKTFESYDDANNFVDDLWPDSGDLEKYTFPCKTFEGMIITKGFADAKKKNAADLYLLLSLAVDDQEKQQIEKTTVGQTKNQMWWAFRMNRITASNFGLVLGAVARNSYPSTLFEILLGHDDEEAEAHEWEIHYKKTAKDFYTKHTGPDIQERGLFLSNSGLLGASPDGTIQSGEIIEVKCPWSARTKTVRQAAENKDFFLEVHGESLKLKETHKYWHQIQGNLFLTEKNSCDLVVWTPEDQVILQVEKDQTWASNIEILETFYREQFLPHLLPQF